MFGTVREVIERLSRRNPEEPIGAIFWDTDDVKDVIATHRNEKIDDQLAFDALRLAITHHDSNHGISSETFIDTVYLLKEERAQR
ncbi:hypothetical protein AGJ34_22000 [Cronobacter dublinensis subsp. dublinensis]|nr:hypothetical protein [Cronobacter dublinensis subsp. dublinensis]EGT5729703.1 hypothetical protein [Cronobacter dublinensis subsp. dublinensis]